MRAEPARALPSLTALRAFAAFAVFGFHATGLLAMLGTGRLGRLGSHLFAAGPTGVSFFFILSGFVLTWSGRASTATSFWRRRAARILPAYLVAWLLGLVVLIALEKSPPAGGSIASLLLVQAWSPDPHVLFAVNIVAWSLAVEVAFYLAFPYLLPLITWLAPRRRLPLMLGLAGVPLLTAAVEQAAHGSSGYLYPVAYFPPARLPEFLIGMLLALEIRDGRWRRIRLLPASTLALGTYLLVGQVPAAFMWVTVTLVPFTLLIAAAAQADLAAGSSWLRHPFATRLGAWSYAFYLVQVPLGLVFAHVWHPLYRPAAAQVVMLLAYAVLTWLVAGAVYAYVERPLHIRLSPRRKLTLPPASIELPTQSPAASLEQAR
jgi:peptidoglycan/LPS O-acetylase OafA/YrhL